MNVRIVCTCGASRRLDVEAAKRALRADHRYAFGDLVTDPRAFPMRCAVLVGWRYVGGELGRTVVAMACPTCAAYEPEAVA